MFKALVAMVTIVAVMPLHSATSAAQASGSAQIERLQGPDRYETSLAAVRRFVAEAGGSIDAVVVVSGTSWQDAVVASGLAGSLDAPVLLTPRGGLTDSASSYLESLQISQIVVVGNADAVSDDAVSAMGSLGTVVRVSEEGASAMSVAVARFMGSPGEMPGHGATAIVANSAVFADAMVASGFSARGGHPVLLTPKGALDQDVQSFVTSGGVEHVVIMGGAGAISESVESELKALDVSVTRLGGTTRLHTALEVAKFLNGKYSDTASDRCFDRTTVGLATAWVPFDAFSAGPLLGELCAPLLLTDPRQMDPDVAEWIRDATSDVIVFGGKSAVSANALASISNDIAMEQLFDRASTQRSAIVAELTRQIAAGNYGIDSDNVLRGPGGFRIYLDDCPDGWSDSAGITPSEIRIGYSAPLTGSLSQFGHISSGIQKYFEWVNENDPIAGRSITVVTKDDANISAITIERVDALIENENVMSIMTHGSPNTLSVYDRLNYECIPHPFNQSGYPAWGDPVLHPWTTGMQLAYNTEARLWGEWIQQNMASQLPVKVAALVMDIEFGLIYELAFAEWAQEHPDVVAEFVAVRHIPWENRVDQLGDKMQEIVAADPDVYVSMTAGPACVSAIQLADTNGLKSSIESSGGALFNPSVCQALDQHLKPAGEAGDGWRALDGGVTSGSDPAGASEPFVEFVNISYRNAGLDVSDEESRRHFGTGYAYGYPYVEALRIAAELPGGLSRTNLILAVRALDIDHPLLADGIKFRVSGAEDAYFIEGTRIAQYDAGSHEWDTSSGVIDVDGQTPNCSWLHGVKEGEFSRCDSPTLERLTTLGVSGAADKNGSTVAWAQAFRADRVGLSNNLKPGYWKATPDSFCRYYDSEAERWAQGSALGIGWVIVSGSGVRFDQSTRIRIGHDDWLQIETWSGGDLGARSCQLDWVAELD